jgi:hypothetical protein
MANVTFKEDAEVSIRVRFSAGDVLKGRIERYKGASRFVLHVNDTEYIIKVDDVLITDEDDKDKEHEDASDA